MKYLTFKRYFAIIAIIAFALSACKKIKTTEPIGDAGQTLVKILGAGSPYALIKDPVSFVNTPYTLTKGVIDIRRDVPNNAELNRTMTIVIKSDTAAVKAADPAYLQLPTSWYTIQTSDNVPLVGGLGGTWTFTMKPGDFAKQIYITIPNATLLNPSALYGVGFTLASADADGIITEQKTVVVEIGAKNNWDGIYEMHGTFLDVSNSAFTYYGDQQYSLVTAGASTCTVINDDLNGGIPGYLFSNAGSGTYYGSYGLIITFNPSNGAISDLHNYYGEIANGGGGPPLYAASNGRRAVLDPSGVNAAQGNKDIIIKHWLFHPSVVPSGPRSFFDETWKYLGPR